MHPDSLNHLASRRDDQAAVLHALRAEDLVGDVVDISRLAAQDDNLQAIPLVQMNVGCRYDKPKVRVLNMVKLLLKVTRMLRRISLLSLVL